LNVEIYGALFGEKKIDFIIYPKKITAQITTSIATIIAIIAIISADVINIICI
jgi:hypothetical protein